MWLIIGLAVGAGVLALALWLRSRDIAVKWYEWLIGAVALLLLIFTIQNFVGSQFELEPTAASMFMLVSGLPGIILGAIAVALIWRRQRASS